MFTFPIPVLVLYCWSVYSIP